MTVQQQQWIDLIRDRGMKLQGTMPDNPEGQRAVQKIFDGADETEAFLNGIKGRSEVESSRQIGAGR